LPSSPLISSPSLVYFLFWKVHYTLKLKFSIKDCKWNLKTLRNLWRMWKLREYVCVIESLNTRHRLPVYASPQEEYTY
jgi:hypothetical protein